MTDMNKIRAKHGFFLSELKTYCVYHLFTALSCAALPKFTAFSTRHELHSTAIVILSIILDW